MALYYQYDIVVIYCPQISSRDATQYNDKKGEF